MRLKSVYISQYKNLRNFELTFDGSSFIDVFVGKNGSGKSNLFEALIEIFRHLDDSRSSMAACGFDYKLSYEMNGDITFVDWRHGKLTVNRNTRKSFDSSKLPHNILIYYSGHNNKVYALVKEYEAKFGKEVKDVSMGQSRLFIGVGSEYKALLLATLLLQAEENYARRFICEKLSIRSVGETIHITLSRPWFADSRLMEITGVKKRKEAQIDGFDPRTHFWGALGIVRSFLEQLTLCIKGGFQHEDIYDRSKDQYVLNLNTELFLQRLASPTSGGLFRAFDTLKTVGMLGEIQMPLKLENGTIGDLNSFSDGQFQSAYIYAIVELFKDSNCLMLLDEPDAFLHPEWQFEFLKQVVEISEVAHERNHLLLSSHSASTITTVSENQIRLIEFNGEKVVVSRTSKAEIIRSLSAGLICFSEAEARLSINHILRNTSGSVLFCEGITDEIILGKAWSKLYPASKCPFDIQSAFDRSFLRNLFARNELRQNYPNRKMFALFDFDDAYEDWKALKTGRDEETDPHKGLTKQLDYAHHYAMLLPVPSVEHLKCQVLNQEGKPWGRGSELHLPIELLFFKEVWVGQWFTRRATSGDGEIIEFTGDKARFANEVIPTLPAEDFELLRPIFEFIKANCTNP